MVTQIASQAEELIANLIRFDQSTLHLDDQYRKNVEKMLQKMNDFFEEFIDYSKQSLVEYTNYLNYEATSPLTVVLGYAELFRSINAHLLTQDTLHHVNLICEQTRILIEYLQTERDHMLTKQNAQIT